jgi:hypothetical protein
MSDEPTCEIDVDDGESNYIEIFVKEYKAPRQSICKTWDRCKHLRSDEFNEQFLKDHPQCE